MRYMKPAFLVLASLLAGFPVLAEFDLRQELDRKTFRESGLEKLSPGELENLNAAVAQLLGIQEEIIRAETELPQGDDRFGLETVKQRVQNLFQSKAPRHEHPISSIGIVGRPYASLPIPCPVVEPTCRTIVAADLQGHDSAGPAPGFPLARR